MNRIVLIIICIFTAINAYAIDSTTVGGRDLDEFEISSWDAITEPAVSQPNTARVYYNGTSDTLKLSVNGGAYSNLLTALTGLGDAVTVNASAVDTTANFSDGDIAWTLVDGGAGGPDSITGTFAADSVDDTHINWGSGAGQVDLADIPGGISGASVWDFGGATSFEVPNTAGNVTCDVAGEMAVDSTNKQLGVYEGAAEVAIPLRHIFQGSIDLAGAWDVDSDVWLWDLDATTYPNGIYITAIYVDCSVADPTTELDANLMYCDAVAGGAFPGANATLIKAIDTTTGNFADAAVNTAVATGKSIYIDLDTDPVDATTVYHLKIYYRIPES